MSRYLDSDPKYNSDPDADSEADTVSDSYPDYIDSSGSEIDPDAEPPNRKTDGLDREFGNPDCEIPPAETNIIRILETNLKYYRRDPKPKARLKRVQKKYIEVEERSREEVVSLIETHLEATSYKMFSRRKKYQYYDEKLKRLVLKKKEFIRNKEKRIGEATTCVLKVAKELCDKNMSFSNRGAFSTKPRVFKEQEYSDKRIDEVCLMLNCTRPSLRIVESEKGLVIGPMSFREGGKFIDCREVGNSGKAIPTDMKCVTEMKDIGSLFILVVEKHSVFMRLVEERFYDTYRCIIVTGVDQPDRVFLRRITTEFRLPVLALVDRDPSGFKILSVFACGSENLSFDNTNLVTPRIKWLGIRHCDIDKYRIPENCQLDMSPQDRATGIQLLGGPLAKSNKKWYRELQLMMAGTNPKKVEIEALNALDVNYLCKFYLPRKLAEKDWI